MPEWMIYGANGYTGELIAREAVRRGQRPILAGRSTSVEALARELGLQARVFALDRPQLSGVAAVLHCAGPFSETSAPMVRACLDAGAHYVDITGEIAVFESIMRLDDEARRRGVTLLPGAGFDVVPTDCLAAMLVARLPSSDELTLAFYSQRGGLSRGTMRTSIEGLRVGGAIRVDGRIVRVPVAFDVRDIPFSCGPRKAMTIPWGDVSTAFHTTGIPNIRVYMAASPKLIARLRRYRWLLPLVSIRPLRRMLQRFVRAGGPSAELRARGRVFLWGRAADRTGHQVSMTMTTVEGYTLTVQSALAAMEGLLSEPVQAGSFTPATRFGADFVTEIPGVIVDPPVTESSSDLAPLHEA